jgi:hypothetical protein
MPRLADGNVSILEPVRIVIGDCFVRVTAISVCESEPVRNAMKASTHARAVFKFLVLQNLIFWRFELIGVVCFP